MEAATADDVYIEHARLKDHVWRMDGRLEARIHEGGEFCPRSRRLEEAGNAGDWDADAGCQVPT